MSCRCDSGGQAELVEHAGRPGVELCERTVVLGSTRVVAHGGVDVAEEFDRMRGRGVEVGSLTQVAEGGIQFATAAVGIAALQVREHRVALEREGAAERLDRVGGFALCQCCVAGGNQTLELALLPDRIPGQHHPHHQRSEADGHHHEPLHIFSARVS